MNEISDLERRIVTALDRIRAGLGTLSSAPATEAPDPAELAELKSRLADERLANAQLEERVRALKERQETRMAALEADAARERDRAASLDSDLQTLRQSNAELRDMIAQMRSALAANLDDPDLVNRAALAELDALRANREADRGEVEAILQELRPIIEEAR